jgi:hypothetical protein
MKNMREVQPEGNYYDKYHSKNVIEQMLLKNFFGTARKMLQEVAPQPFLKWDVARVILPPF